MIYVYAFMTGVWSHSASLNSADVAECQAVFRPLAQLFQVLSANCCHYQITLAM